MTVVGADPEGSIYSDPTNVHGYSIEGVGEDFYPAAYDQTIADATLSIIQSSLKIFSR